MSRLRSFLDELRRRGELVDVRIPVDPRLEMTEIACRLAREAGPAAVFHRPVGGDVPVVLNALGTRDRLSLALGAAPEDLAARTEAFLRDAVPPSAAGLWRHRGLLWRGLSLRTREIRRPAWGEVREPCDLSRLPVLTTWPEDGGPFITWPAIVTRHPERGDLNLGLYRMQVFGPSLTGMHWQIAKGGGFHHHAAERLGRDLPCAVALSADPLVLFAAMLPLPEGVSELAFAGFLRGQATPVVRLASGLCVPAEADIVLEGVVPCGERRLEGPFGDHFGHYSHASEFPVFRIERWHRRRDPLYVAAVVGKPPQEDRVLGEAAQDLFLPFLRFTRPEVRDAWAHHETGFHGLMVASVRPRYEKESLKTAFSLLGEGQVSLSKVLVLVPHEVDCRDAEAVLATLATHFDAGRDVLVLANSSADTLDFTGPRVNHGSKLVLDLTTRRREGAPPPLPPPDVGAGRPAVLGQRLVAGTTLLVRLADGSDGRALLGDLLADPRLAAIPLVVVVSADVDLADRVSWLWGVFTRFDPARDVRFRASRLEGAVAAHEGPLGIDATWKLGYPKPLAMPDEIVRRVDERWTSYGFAASARRASSISR